MINGIRQKRRMILDYYVYKNINQKEIPNYLLWDGKLARYEKELARIKKKT